MVLGRGYHIGCTLSPEDRRRSESDLLAYYLDRLHGEGVEAPSWDEAGATRRRGLLYGFFLWAITLKVAPPITTVMLERLGSAVADHRAYESVAPRMTANRLLRADPRTRWKLKPLFFRYPRTIMTLNHTEHSRSYDT